MSEAPTTCPACGSAQTLDVPGYATREEYEARNKREERPRWEYACGAVIGGGDGSPFFEVNECNGAPRPSLHDALQTFNRRNPQLAG